MTDGNLKMGHKILTGDDVTMVRAGDDLKLVHILTRRKFVKYTVGTAACVFLGALNTGCGGGTDESKFQGYPISSEVFTTRDRTVVPDPAPTGSPIFPYEVSKYKQYGYGNWQYGSGIDMGKQSDIMPAGYNVDSVTNTARLLNFFAITDIHINDNESPVQCQGNFVLT